jgi:hypothetical protein
MPLDVFEADWQRQWLVERGVEIISEASRHLTDELKARRPEIPRRRLSVTSPRPAHCRGGAPDGGSLQRRRRRRPPAAKLPLRGRGGVPGPEMTGKHPRNTGPMLAGPRCRAKTRSGKPCMSPAASGKKRCAPCSIDSSAEDWVRSVKSAPSRPRLTHPESTHPHLGGAATACGGARPGPPPGAR